MKEATTLAFTGDIGFDHYMQNKWEDENLIDPSLLDILTTSDHVIANVEGPLAGEDAVRVKAAEMRLMHTIDPRAVVVLQKIHADIWNLANNHIMDVGPDGLAMTLEEAKKCGAATIGLLSSRRRAASGSSASATREGVNPQVPIRPVVLAGATWIPLRK